MVNPDTIFHEGSADGSFAGSKNFKEGFDLFFYTKAFINARGQHFKTKVDPWIDHPHK